MSDIKWDFAGLLLFASAQGFDASLIGEQTRSIARSDSIFRYHITTARDALKGIINYDEPQGIDNWMLLLGGSERQEDFYYAKIVSEANLIACAYTARSLLEMFAQLVNSLLLSSAIPISKCTLKKVAEKLPPGELKVKLQELFNSHWFIYVYAFTNTIKHRQLVQHQTSICFVDNKVGVKVGSFTYENIAYQAYWATEFLQGIIDVKNELVGSGRALNRACGL
jgi:hypothetical protein